MSHLRVQNLSKAFKRYPRKYGRFAEWLGFPPQHEKKWVLSDISFDVFPGEAVGILGVNGAGKSTLLKIITGTTKATSGTVEVGGRVSALLELGMGFHPEFTGRQNVLMSGQMHGIPYETLLGLIPEIELFADIGDYLDQPVRVYSSGMQVRLAFAVATALRPEILIIDEALSVGDVAFQRKCFRRIEEFRDKGTTLLFVTHNVETVKAICSRALLLRDGKLVEFGPAKEVCDIYEKQLFGNNTAVQAGVESAVRPIEKSRQRFDPALASDCEVSYGDGRAIIDSIWLENENGTMANIFASDDPIFVAYSVRFQSDVASPIFAMMLKTRNGVAVFGTDTSGMSQFSDKLFRSGQTVCIKFRLENSLAAGIYFLNCGVRDDTGEQPIFLHRRVDAKLFRIVADKENFAKSGLVNLRTSVIVIEQSS